MLRCDPVSLVWFSAAAIDPLSQRETVSDPRSTSGQLTTQGVVGFGKVVGLCLRRLRCAFEFLFLRPGAGRDLGDLLVGHVRQAFEHVLEVGVGIDPVGFAARQRSPGSHLNIQHFFLFSMRTRISPHRQC